MHLFHYETRQKFIHSLFLKKHVLNYLTLEEYKTSKEIMCSNLKLCIDHLILLFLCMETASTWSVLITPKHEDTIRYNILKLMLNFTLKSARSVDLDPHYDVILVNKHHTTNSVKVAKLCTVTSSKEHKNDQLQKNYIIINILFMKFLILKCKLFFTKSENFSYDEIQNG